jgi:hypothetical protein
MFSIDVMNSETAVHTARNFYTIFVSFCLENLVNINLVFMQNTDLTQYFSVYKIEKKEMGGACRAYGGGERRIQGFGGET